jgi:hypothetical protein
VFTRVSQAIPIAAFIIHARLKGWKRKEIEKLNTLTIFGFLSPGGRG